MSKGELRDEQIREMVTIGSEAFGGASGTALGVVLGGMLGGPAGAIAGAAGGPLFSASLRRVTNEFVRRSLAPREEARVGGLLALAAEKIRKNLDDGQELRQDGFFSDSAGDRPASEEVFEAVIFAAQREPEEKKIKYYSNLLANIAFRPEIDRAQANFLVNLANSLSYRQICFLPLFFVNTINERNPYQLKDTDYRNSSEKGDLGADLVFLLQEIYDLYARGLVNAGGAAMLGVSDVVPATMRLQGISLLLFELMEAQHIPSEDLNPIIGLLRDPPIKFPRM